MVRASDMRIRAAAVLTECGEIVWFDAPARHNDVLLSVAERGLKAKGPGTDGQGFITDCGRFLRRQPAGTVARASGQIDKLKWPHIGLNSEDMW